ncbi:MAG: tetraacyldisaccharide 4'-kinase [Pseudomonadota bacterium]
MKAPGYWYNPPDAPGFMAHVLTPLGAAYAFATARRVARPPRFRAEVPVICVGNLNAGGTGKTPAVISLVQHLQARGRRPAVISRGYGGTATDPTEVRERRHTPGDVGDEPLLVAAFTRTWVGRDRAATARLAVSSGVDAIIMDDGHQNPDVAKDLSIVIVDAGQGFGNGRSIPSGPLREPVARGLSRADLLISVGGDAAQRHFGDLWGTCINVPWVRASLEPLQTGMDWTGLRVMAFAGIGHPEKFFSTLRRLGADIARAEALEDHQPLTQTLVTRLENEATLLGAQLVTTEKDAVRLPPEFRQKVLTLPVRMQIPDWSEIDRFLARLGL